MKVLFATGEGLRLNSNANAVLLLLVRGHSFVVIGGNSRNATVALLQGMVSIPDKLLPFCRDVGSLDLELTNFGETCFVRVMLNFRKIDGHGLLCRFVASSRAGVQEMTCLCCRAHIHQICCWFRIATIRCDSGNEKKMRGKWDHSTVGKLFHKPPQPRKTGAQVY